MTGLLFCRVTKRKLLIMASKFWVGPLPSNSHHKDYYIFGFGDSYKPSFANVAGKGGNPKYILQVLLCQQIMNKNIGMSSTKHLFKTQDGSWILLIKQT